MWQNCPGTPITQEDDISRQTACGNWSDTAETKRQKSPEPIVQGSPACLRSMSAVGQGLGLGQGQGSGVFSRSNHGNNELSAADTLSCTDVYCKSAFRRKYWAMNHCSTAVSFPASISRLALTVAPNCEAVEVRLSGAHALPAPPTWLTCLPSRSSVARRLRWVWAGRSSSSTPYWSLVTRLAEHFRDSLCRTDSDPRRTQTDAAPLEQNNKTEEVTSTQHFRLRLSN